MEWDSRMYMESLEQWESHSHVWLVIDSAIASKQKRDNKWRDLEATTEVETLHCVGDGAGAEGGSGEVSLMPEGSWRGLEHDPSFLPRDSAAC